MLVRICIWSGTWAMLNFKTGRKKFLQYASPSRNDRTELHPVLSLEVQLRWIFVPSWVILKTLRDAAYGFLYIDYSGVPRSYAPRGSRITFLESSTSKYNKNIRYLTYRCLQICWRFGGSVVTVYIAYICIHIYLYTGCELNIKLQVPQICR